MYRKNAQRHYSCARILFQKNKQITFICFVLKLSKMRHSHTCTKAYVACLSSDSCLQIEFAFAQRQNSIDLSAIKLLSSSQGINGKQMLMLSLGLGCVVRKVSQRWLLKDEQLPEGGTCPRQRRQWVPMCQLWGGFDVPVRLLKVMGKSNEDSACSRRVTYRKKNCTS